MYTVYANQKDVCVKKPGARNPFYMVEEKYLWTAVKELTHGGLKLWHYLSSNANNFKFALSHKAVNNVVGMSKGTYDNAVKELIDKGYLIRCGDTNHFYFVVDPTLRNGMSQEEYFEWCDKTSKKGYKWTSEDYDEGDDEDYLTWD